MKIPVPPKYQSIGFWLSMPFITLTLCYIIYDERIFEDWRIFALAYPVIYAIGYLSYRGHYIYDQAIHQRYPSLKDTRKRVLAILPVNILVMTPSVLLIFFVFHWFNILGYTLQTEDLVYGYLTGLCVNVIFESLWEVIYIIDRYREAAYEQERIEQMHLRQEFDNLKAKVNPHFLFNSFNTLSSLITENKQQASKFLDELSKVYRYLLRNNESGMSTVDQETKFIASYSRLLETRYGDAFKMEIRIDPVYKDKEIPSLTLQMLVENAVKHNILSKQRPVKVDIYSTPDGHIVIENNLNKKVRTLAESTGIGLSNIRDKYKLLNRLDVSIEEKDDKFRVEIPVLT